MNHHMRERQTWPTSWVKPSASTNPQGCVQVRSPREGMTEIGDTKNPDGPTLIVPHAAWDHFLNQIATGHTAYGRLRPEFLADGGFALTDTAAPNPPLWSTPKPNGTPSSSAPKPENSAAPTPGEPSSAEEPTVSPRQNTGSHPNHRSRPRCERLLNCRAHQAQRLVRRRHPVRIGPPSHRQGEAHHHLHPRQAPYQLTSPDGVHQLLSR